MVMRMVAGKVKAEYEKMLLQLDLVRLSNSP